MVRITIVVEEAGVKLAYGSVEHQSMGEAEVLAARTLPGLVARAMVVQDAQAAARRLEREWVLEQNRPVAARNLLPGCLRAAGLRANYNAWGPATHADIDRAAEVLGVAGSPRRPQGWARDMPVSDRWRELSALVVARIVGGEPVLGLTLDALDTQVKRMVHLP